MTSPDTRPRRTPAPSPADLAAALTEHHLPTTWTAPDGTTYDLTRPLIDRDGDTWHLLPTVWPTVWIGSGRCRDRPLAQLIADYGPLTQPDSAADTPADQDAQPFLATRLAIAVRALTRLAYTDAMAGGGQSDVGYEMRARCRYAQAALERIAYLTPTGHGGEAGR